MGKGGQIWLKCITGDLIMMIRDKNNIFERVENFHADLAWNYPVSPIRELFLQDHHFHCQVRNSTWYVVYTSIPALAAGLCFKPFKKEEILNNPAIYNVLIFFPMMCFFFNVMSNVHLSAGAASECGKK